MAPWKPKEESFKKEAIIWQTKRWSKMRLEQWPVVTLTKIVVSVIRVGVGVEVGLKWWKSERQVRK